MERKKLKIIDVSEPKPYGQKGGTLIKIKGESSSGVSMMYTCFISNLFECFQVGAVVDCDTETKQNGEYADNYINQVYKDGQPVTQKKGYRGRSPEETASIEAQCVSKQITDAWIAGKLSDSDPFVLRLKEYWNCKLPGKASTPAAQSKPVPASVKPAASSNGKAPEDTLSEFKNAGELMTHYFKEKGMSATAICQKLGVKSATEIKDLAAAVKKLEGK